MAASGTPSVATVPRDGGTSSLKRVFVTVPKSSHAIVLEWAAKRRQKARDEGRLAAAQREPGRPTRAYWLAAGPFIRTPLLIPDDDRQALKELARQLRKGHKSQPARKRPQRIGHAAAGVAVPRDGGTRLPAAPPPPRMKPWTPDRSRTAIDSWNMGSSLFMTAQALGITIDQLGAHLVSQGEAESVDAFRREAMKRGISMM